MNFSQPPSNQPRHHRPSVFFAAAAAALVLAAPAQAQRVSLSDMNDKLDELLARVAPEPDGVVHINQGCAAGNGCLAGDAPGYPVQITVPGSYRVTSELVGAVNTDGIVIDTDDVTLDLNGFTLVGVGGSSGHGVRVVVSGGATSRSNITVRGGIIRSWGDAGIGASLALSSRFENLALSDNQGAGILAGDSNVIVGSLARNNASNGIDAGNAALVKDCVAIENGANGIQVSSGGSVLNSTSNENGTHGFDTGTNSTVENSTARENGVHGFGLGIGSVLRGSTGVNNGRQGVFASAATLIVNNAFRNNGRDISYCDDPGRTCPGISASVDSYVLNNVVDQQARGSGIRIVSSEVRVDGNHVTDSDEFGIDAPIAGNRSLFIRNSASDNALGAYNIAGGNVVGPILVNTATTTEPFANFAY